MDMHAAGRSEGGVQHMLAACLAGGGHGACSGHAGGGRRDAVLGHAIHTRGAAAQVGAGAVVDADGGGSATQPGQAEGGPDDASSCGAAGRGAERQLGGGEAIERVGCTGRVGRLRQLQ